MGDMSQSLAVALFILAIAADRLWLVLNNTKMRSPEVAKIVVYFVWTFSIGASLVGPVHEYTIEINGTKSIAALIFFSSFCSYSCHWYTFQTVPDGENSTRGLWESEKVYMRKGRVANNYDTYGHQTPICELISGGAWDRLHAPMMFAVHILIHKIEKSRKNTPKNKTTYS